MLGEFPRPWASRDVRARPRPVSTRNRARRYLPSLWRTSPCALLFGAFLSQRSQSSPSRLRSKGNQTFARAFKGEGEASEDAEVGVEPDTFNASVVSKSSEAGADDQPPLPSF
jgi:hypothetical protein